MRRSRRYRDKHVLVYDLETQSTKTHVERFLGEIAMMDSVLTAESQRERAHHGWINWHMNRGRLPLIATDAELRAYKRRVSWRRVH